MTIYEGESVNFQGSVEDGDAPFTYSWDFDGSASDSDREDPGDVTFQTPGVYTVTFFVSDDDDDTDSDSVTITVKPDHSVIASIASPSSNLTIYEGEPVNFQGSVEDGDAPFTYS